MVIIKHISADSVYTDSQVILQLEVKHSTEERMGKRLKEHEGGCFAFAAQRTEFPDDPILKKQVQAPFTVYADFKSILKQLSAKCQEHIACSYAYQIFSSIPGIEFGKQRLYVGVDAACNFLDALQEDLNEKDVDMIWNDEAEEKFKSATHCHVCKKPVVAGDKVRDHCHFTGRFPGAAHNHCNLKYKIDKQRYKLPIVFHNLRGYDAHLIFQKVKLEYGKINVIPNSKFQF